MTTLQPTIFYMLWSLAEKKKHSLEEKTWWESDPYINSSEEGSYEESEEEHSDSWTINFSPTL